MARPRKEINAEQVEKLAAIHCTMEEIAAVMGCSVDLLEQRFSDIIKRGKANGRTSLRRHQWKLAEKGNATMLIWLGKQLLGQRDQIQEHVQVQALPPLVIDMSGQALPSPAKT
jgi:hypothetical protein